jgi:hypothetical protein
MTMPPIEEKLRRYAFVTCNAVPFLIKAPSSRWRAEDCFPSPQLYSFSKTVMTLQHRF